MNLIFDAIYYEPEALQYGLGITLHEKYADLKWTEIRSHNRIPDFCSAENSEFARLKQHLVIGVRKTHKYMPNGKVSNWLVPYTSSGCRAMCLYCYLVCNYNKCSYLRLFVNREEMMEKLLKADGMYINPQVFEIGSNSDLIMENAVTGNLPWTIERFSQTGKGKITFPTKFDDVQPLLAIEHRGKVIFRMSVNPQEIVRQVEIGTSNLNARIQALNAVCDAGYPVGLIIAPVILIPEWRRLYGELIDQLADELSIKVRSSGFIEIILMTYSYVQNAINTEAFPNAARIFDSSLMTGRGRGKYCYRSDVRSEAEAFLRDVLGRCLPTMPILYIS